jgi:hypothetical protein
MFTCLIPEDFDFGCCGESFRSFLVVDPRHRTVAYHVRRHWRDTSAPEEVLSQRAFMVEVPRQVLGPALFRLLDDYDFHTALDRCCADYWDSWRSETPCHDPHPEPMSIERLKAAIDMFVLVECGGDARTAAKVFCFFPTEANKCYQCDQCLVPEHREPANVQARWCHTDGTLSPQTYWLCRTCLGEPPAPVGRPCHQPVRASGKNVFA